MSEHQDVSGRAAEGQSMSSQAGPSLGGPAGAPSSEGVSRDPENGQASACPGVPGHAGPGHAFPDGSPGQPGDADPIEHQNASGLEGLGADGPATPSYGGPCCASPFLGVPVRAFSPGSPEDIDSGDSEPFPLDFDALLKGDVIQPETIERIYEVTRDTKKYQLHVMRLKQRIEDELAARGYPVSIKMEADALRILTDAEAVEYNALAFERGVSTLARAHRRLTAVDVAQLGQADTEKHDRLMCNQATQLQALRSTRRSLGQTQNQIEDKS